MAKSGQHGGNVRQMALKYGKDPAGILDFSANINPLGLPATLRQAITENLTCLEQYPDIDYQDLHQALASYHHCHPDEVLAGNGATELIFSWVSQFRPEKALLVEPGFAEYRRALERHQCDIATHYLRQEDDFGITEALVGQLSDDLDCLFLCTPNNPTGLLPDPEIMTLLLERCAELKIRLFIDESFMDFLPDHDGVIPLIRRYPNLFVLRSLTKFYAIPGLRLGYMVSGDRPSLRAMHMKREPWTINALAALAGGILLNDHQYASDTHRWLKQEQEHLFSALSAEPKLKVYPPAANYVFFHLLDPSLDLQSALMAQGILIRHCANYPGLTDRYYRVAIKSEQDNTRLIRTLRQILRQDNLHG